ncbi:CIC11C00000001801 [Sungouiella intermedia]|uniref:CIC11C00000001801 n=1 Tax=Sungouiella intermedia TaxID=45354 RepID=A0A1L0C4G5_9ASCO|nr:CIC11C00000001801 [[Candida] intermedia]
MVTYWKIHWSELDDPVYYKNIQQKIQAGLATTASEVDNAKNHIKYPEYLVRSKIEDEGKYNNQTNPGHENNDKGHLGNPTFENLFKSPKVKTFDLSPNLGTEIDGVQLSQLDDAGKNDLALFLETRGLAVFRNQDLRDKGPQFASEFGNYFGPLHIHPIAYSAENHPELLVTFRNSGDGSRYKQELLDSTTSLTYGWHSDISFEEYPASFSFFVALEAPPSGGDTIFIDLREAYKRLSPTLQKFFETLTVVHSNYHQNKVAALRGLVAKVKADYFTEHPLVRTHPVTGEKSLYFSRLFIHKIKGVKPSESAAILNFLEDHVTNNPEFQVRATHKGTDSRTVIAWDNRFLLHSATGDFLEHETGPRHHYRITVLGEKPYFEKSLADLTI